MEGIIQAWRRRWKKPQCSSAPLKMAVFPLSLASDIRTLASPHQALVELQTAMAVARNCFVPFAGELRRSCAIVDSARTVAPQCSTSELPPADHTHTQPLCGSFARLSTARPSATMSIRSQLFLVSVSGRFMPLASMSLSRTFLNVTSGLHL